MSSGLRLVSWNIYEGLLTADIRETGVPEVCRRRAGLAADLIDRLAPDILVLNEALYCEPYDGFMIDYAWQFGFTYSHPHLYDAAWGNIILSRHPILATQQHLIYQPDEKRRTSQNRGASAILIEHDEKPVWIATHHPHPHRHPQKRAADFAAFLAAMPGEKIIAGDFNAISPEDRPQREDLIAGFLTFQTADRAVASVDRMIEAGTLLFNDVMPRHGMRDLMATHGRAATIPTALRRSDPRSAMRIDHAWGSTGIKVGDARVVLDPRVDQASDHYPIQLDFTL